MNSSQQPLSLFTCRAIQIATITESSQSPLTSSQGYCVLSIHQPSRHWLIQWYTPRCWRWHWEDNCEDEIGKRCRGLRYNYISFLRLAPSWRRLQLSDGVGCGRGWSGGGGWGGARKRLMALSVKTVIVRCRWASQSSVADGCVHVPATYQLKPAVGEEVGWRERDSTAGTVSHFSSCHLIHDW